MQAVVKYAVGSTWRRVAAGMTLATLVLAGCDSETPDGLGPAGAEAPAAAALSYADAQETGQEFARALARTLDQPAMRNLVHRAMRDSRFNEHKLVLQEFAGTPAGGRLVRAMAAANGVDESVVRGWISRMPPMDFYVPFVQHRRGWTGGAELVVGANMSIDETRFTGYTPEGTAVAFDARAGAPAQTVVFLHPSEPKGILPASSSRDYATVEDPDAPVYVTTISPGDAEPNLVTNPVATYVGRVEAFKNWVGDGLGGIELLVKHYAGRNGTRISDEVMDEAMHWGWDGYYWDDITKPNRAINFASFGETWIKVYERDSGAEGGWMGDSDDFWGEGAFGGFGVKHRFYPGGVVHLDPSHPCYLSPSAGGCPTPPNVDILYATDPNQPPAGSGGFPAGDLANYTIHNTAGAWSIVSGHLTANGSARQSIALRNGVTITDGWVETETDQAVDGGLVLRAQNNGGNHYLLAIRDDSRHGHANIQIYKAVNGTYSALSSQVDLSFPRGVNKKIRFEAVGSSLKAYFDNTLVAQATDGTWTSGLLGVRANHANSTDQTRYAVLRWNVVSPTDNFNDAGSLGNYTLINTPEAWSVASGHLFADTGARQAIALRNGVTLQNGWVETRTDQVADGGLVLRAQNTTSYYLLAIRDDSRFGHANIEIYKAYNGTFTALTPQIDLSFPAGTQKTVRFEATGTTLKAYVNGTLVTQATDASFTSGLVGLRASGRDGESLTSRFDLFTFNQQ